MKRKHVLFSLISIKNEFGFVPYPKIFQEFDFSQNQYYLAQLDDHNPSMTRNPNPTSIQENNESRSRTTNPSLTTIQDVARNPNPTSIQDVIRNPYPT